MLSMSWKFASSFSSLNWGLQFNLSLLSLDTESQSFPESSKEKILRELSTNFTYHTNDSTSSSNASLIQHPFSVVKRRRRGIGWRNGRLDWWYGNWCGAYQGGYENNPKPHCRWSCDQTKSYVNRACRDCLPPKDGFDEACMEHDRYNIW